MARRKPVGRLEITRTRKGLWTWRKRASNGQIVAGAWDSFVKKSHAIAQAKREYPGLDAVAFLPGKGVFQV